MAKADFINLDMEPNRYNIMLFVHIKYLYYVNFIESIMVMIEFI